LENEVIWGHIDILIVAVRRLSRRWEVKTLLAGPSPTNPMRRWLPTPLFPIDIVINLNGLIGSRYKTIHQVIYKTKDKERKERTRARLLYT